MRIFRLPALTILVAMVVGCTNRPSRVEVPRLDGRDVGGRAIEELDTDGDGQLSKAEREEAPALEAAMRRLDANGDDLLSAEEIAERIEFYHEFKAGLLSATCDLRKDGRPVVGAKVTFEPEEFMGDAALPGFGTTGDTGGTVISMDEEHLPGPNYAGLQPGFYRLRVTLADGTDATDLNAGVEVAGDIMNTFQFALP